MKVAFWACIALFVSALSAGAATDRLTSADSAPMKDCSNTARYPTVHQCFAALSEADHGFYLLKRDRNGRPIKTRQVALLVHGLSDSPYFYRDIAQVLFRQGINVVAIRLTGHGSAQHHLIETSRQHWFADVRWGMERAKFYGHHLLLGGMSLGGALVVREALEDDRNIAGLLLFSPALAMPWQFRLACLRKHNYRAQKEYGVGVRYQAIANNGTCELHQINRAYRQHPAVRRHRKLLSPGRTNQKLAGEYDELLNYPVFTVLTVFDGAIDLDRTYRFTRLTEQQNNGATRLLLFTGENRTDKKGRPIDPEKLPEQTVFVSSSELRHASVLLRPSNGTFTPEVNPEFARLAAELRRFIQDYY